MTVTYPRWIKMEFAPRDNRSIVAYLDIWGEKIIHFSGCWRERENELNIGGKKVFDRPKKWMPTARDFQTQEYVKKLHALEGDKIFANN